MNSQFDKHDIEFLLLSKTIEEMDAEVLLFLEAELGGMNQVRAYRSMLLRTGQALDIEKAPKLELPLHIKDTVRARMTTREPHKDGFEVIVAALLALFPMGKQAVRLGLGAVLIFLLGISGTHYNGQIMNGTNALADSLSMQLRNQPLRMLADSSAQNAPLYNRIEETVGLRWILSGLKD